MKKYALLAQVTKVKIRICVMLENGIRDAEHQMIPKI